MTDTNQQIDNIQRDMKFYCTIKEAIADKKIKIKGEMAHFFKVVFAFASDPNGKILLFFDGYLSGALACQHENDLLDRPAIVDNLSRLVWMASGTKCGPVAFGPAYNFADLGRRHVRAGADAFPAVA